ncbi:MAG: acetolactate synthase small subunit [Candidatus Omnitrophica bacterium]|nr:acetolactate synthase small subunit [Candidatus Omnitrophota bacterium]
MKYTLSVLVENKSGVLAHVAGLFSARGFNIDSLAVGETEDPSISRMTIVGEGDERTMDQVKKQLNKLIDVIKIYDLSRIQFIDRELMLIRVVITPKDRERVIDIVDSVRGASVADVGDQTLTVEATGDQTMVHALIELLRPFGIKEIVRTGKIAMAINNKK